MPLYPGATTFPGAATYPAPVVAVFNNQYKPAQVAAFLGGDVYTFDYTHADVADSFVYSAGNWGVYSVEGDLSVADIVQQPPGGTYNTITFSVLTSHLDSITSAHVHYEGEIVSLSYSTGGTFTYLPEDGAINLAASDYLDIKVTLYDAASQLTSLTVYLMASETFKSPKGRVLTCGAPSPIRAAGLELNHGATIVPVPSYDFEQIPGVTFTPVGDHPTTVGTVEMWCLAPNGANGVVVSGFKDLDWLFVNTDTDDTTASFTEDAAFSSYAKLKLPLTFREKYAQVQLVAPTGDEASNMYMTFTSSDGANTLFWNVHVDRMTAGYTVGATETDIYTLDYDGSIQWFRIHEDQGTVYWSNSPDGTTWTLRSSVELPFDMTHGSLQIGAGNDTGEIIPPVTATGFQLGDMTGLFGQNGTVYVDGSLNNAVPEDGEYHHVVQVLTTPGNVGFTLGPVLTINHLAFYPNSMNAADVADLFLHSSGGSRLISVVDSMPFAVTPAPREVDVYAYSWSVVSGGTQ
jgi:hypothetical protein